MSTLLKVALMSGGTVALRSGGTCDSGTKVAASVHNYLKGLGTKKGEIPFDQINSSSCSLSKPLHQR